MNRDRIAGRELAVAGGQRHDVRAGRRKRCRAAESGRVPERHGPWPARLAPRGGHRRAADAVIDDRSGQQRGGGKRDDLIGPRVGDWRRIRRARHRSAGDPRPARAEHGAVLGVPRRIQRLTAALVEAPSADQPARCRDLSILAAQNLRRRARVVPDARFVERAREISRGHA